MTDDPEDSPRPIDDWRRLLRPVARPPGKRPKRLPFAMLTCSLCGGPNVSRPGAWLGRGEYAAECASGCWGCAECGEMHRGDEDCPYSEADPEARASRRTPPTPDEGDDIPF